MHGRIFPACSAAAMMLVLLEGCSSGNALGHYGPGAYTLSGTMHFLHVETGCWQLTADDGKGYELTGTDVTLLQKENLHAEIIVRSAAHIKSTCMAGTVIELLHIL